MEGSTNNNSHLSKPQWDQVESNTTAGAQASSSTREDSPSMTEQALNVLLVDDDEIDRLLVQHSLKQAQPLVMVSVTEAKDAKSSVELLKDHRFDCILLDFNLPDAWGTAIQPHLFRCRWSRVVAISAPRTAL